MTDNIDRFDLMRGLGPPSAAHPFEPFTRDQIEQSIPARFARQVSRRPASLAVKCGDDMLSYAALDARANRIARAVLACRGPRPEPVLLLLEQGLALVASILGALKAGKIYVPLDASFPPVRVADVVADCEPGLVLTDARNLPLVRQSVPSAVTVLGVDEIEHGADAEDPGVSIAPEAGAYIYYTSGSTGRPKGVLDTHRNVLHNVMRYTNSLQIAPDDRLTLLQGPSFSGAVSSLFGALLNGAAVFPFDVPGQGVDQIAAWLGREQITIYHSVPALFRHVATSGEAFPALRLIRLEGDQASVRDAQLYQRHFPRACSLVNGLGATECGIVRQFFMGPETPLPEGVMPIGYPVEDMDVLILDETGREAPAGDIGEIAVRSRFLAAGYWRRPEQTAAAFAPAPGLPGTRIYRTGDLGRYRPDGCLEHLGRKDFQPKIRGQRVEAAPVEAVLLELSQVKEAAVATHEDPGGDPRLVAYVVPARRPAPTVSALRRHLADRLPDHMVPSAWVMLDSLPLTTNAKVDRRALPPPGPERPELDQPYVPPSNLLQTQLVLIWEPLLGVSPVGIRDSFFDLGGHSLLAVRMLDEVERATGQRLSPSLLLTSPTIEHLSEAIQAGASAFLGPIIPIQTGGSRPPFFFLHGDYLTGGFYCLDLGRRLGPEQPLYAVSPIGLDGGPIPDSFEAMAAMHVRALRALAPVGPYLLGGQCNGGMLAFEMARQLRAQGQEIALLVLVGASAMNMRFTPRRGPIGGLGALLRRGPIAQFDEFRALVLYWDGLPPWERVARSITRGGKITLAAARLLSGRLRARSGSATAPAGGNGDARANPEPETTEARRQRIREAYRRLDNRYTPGRYPGRVLLLWPSEDGELPQAARWWRKVAAEVELRVIPGNHVTCLTTHVAHLAAEINRGLEGVADAPGARPSHRL